MSVLKNSKGNVYYGMHFYPGVAEYSEAGKDPYRIFINEDTIRKMNPTFAGRPIFVEHVDEVNKSVDDLRKDADGWVVESFFNSADGKTWVKFIVVSERGERAIKNGFKLSNAYVPKSFGQGGLWNGVSYQKAVTDGEYEHLAIVRNPRYEESEILTPEAFKAYNENRVLELKKLANAKTEKGEPEMKLNIFKKKVEKVENTADFEGMHITLPKTGKEMSLIQIVNAVDDMEDKKDKPKMANAEDEVMVGEEKMKISDILAQLEALKKECEELKGGKSDVESMDNEEDAEMEASESMENEEDEGEASDKKIAEEKKKNSTDKKVEKKDPKQDETFKALKNAHLKSQDAAPVVLMSDKVAIGKSRYGSN